MAEAEPVTLSYQDGARAVELAREAVEAYVLNGQREHPGSMRESFYQRTGAFVRLESGGRLRGCAGTYETSQHLGRGIVDAAIEAASESSCGSEVEAAELSGLTASVCIVSDITLTDDPHEDLEVGRHGAAVDGRGHHGWMYPTLPLDHGWGVYDYLDRTCRKAGLPRGAWEEEDVMVTLFEGNVFRERSPGGEIEEIEV